ERSVVALVVDRSLSGRPVVRITGSGRSVVERVDRVVVLRLERNVEVLRWLAADDGGGAPVPPEVDSGGALVAGPEAAVRCDRLVEPLGGLEVSDTDPQVVDRSGAPDAAVMHCLAPVAARSGKKAPV